MDRRGDLSSGGEIRYVPEKVNSCLSKDYRKILFVLPHHNTRRQQTLAAYYVKPIRHIIPFGVEVWEFDETGNTARQIGISA
jgi:hypothetical protein